MKRSRLSSKVDSIIISPVKARLGDFSSTERIRPYIAFELGNQHKKTATDTISHRDPSWSSKLHFNLQGWETDLVIKLYNSVRRGTDELLSKGSIDVQELVQSGTGIQKVYLKDYGGSLDELWFTYDCVNKSNRFSTIRSSRVSNLTEIRIEVKSTKVE